MRALFYLECTCEWFVSDTKMLIRMGDIGKLGTMRENVITPAFLSSSTCLAAMQCGAMQAAHLGAPPCARPHPRCMRQMTPPGCKPWPAPQGREGGTGRSHARSRSAAEREVRGGRRGGMEEEYKKRLRMQEMNRGTREGRGTFNGHCDE